MTRVANFQAGCAEKCTVATRLSGLLASAITYDARLRMKSAIEDYQDRDIGIIEARLLIESKDESASD